MFPFFFFFFGYFVRHGVRPFFSFYPFSFIFPSFDGFWNGVYSFFFFLLRRVGGGCSRWAGFARSTFSCFIISLHTMIPGKPLFYWNGGSFTSFCFALFCMYIVLLVARGQRPVYNLWSRRFPIACSLLSISCFIGSTEIIFSFFFVLFILISYSHVRGTGIQHIFFFQAAALISLPHLLKKRTGGGQRLKAVKQVEAPAARTSVSGWHGLSWHYFQTPPLIASAATGRIGLLGCCGCGWLCHSRARASHVLWV